MLNIIAPIVLPVVSNTTVSVNYEEGRLAYTTANELILGSDNGFNRSAFPFNNTEILTEIGTKTQRVFGLMIREQNIYDYYLSAIIPAGENVPLRLRDRPGGYAHDIRIPTNGSAVITLHVCKDSGDISPKGTFRILADSNTANQVVAMDEGYIVHVDLSIGDLTVENGESFFPIYCANLSVDTDISLLVKIVTVNN